jgi:hypothetical protein
MTANETDYRYTLQRRLPGGEGRAIWILLNPSTADERSDDPTIRRCIGFTNRWGLSNLIVINLYARRTTRPADLRRLADPVGPDNDGAIRRVLSSAGGAVIICGWGVHAAPGRSETVYRMITEHGLTAHALGSTRSGQPRHPLYVPYAISPQPWRSPTAQRT